MGSFDKVLSAIDEYNLKDDKKELFEGRELSSELIYSIKVTNWVVKLNPKPSEELLIAARGVHVGRFDIPRDKYPAGLIGYHQWKSFLYRYHADKVASIMEANGYLAASIEKTKNIIMRKNIKIDADTQTLEDAVSLVFLEDQLLPLIKKTSKEKVINAIVKTWAKMSSLGQSKAMLLDLPSESKKMLDLAFN